MLDCTGSLNVAVTVVVVATPVAPDAGAVAVTVGGVVSVPAPAAVVKDQVVAVVMVLPAVSLAPLPPSRCRWSRSASAAVGVNVAFWLALS